MFFKSAQKVGNQAALVMTPLLSRIFGYFCKKTCHQDTSKIAQSGHTEFRRSRCSGRKDSPLNRPRRCVKSFATHNGTVFSITRRRRPAISRNWGFRIFEVIRGGLLFGSLKSEKQNFLSRKRESELLIF